MSTHRGAARSWGEWGATTLDLVLVATAAGAECPQVVGQWGYGRIHTVEVVDGFAYYGMGDDLVVDVRDPVQPQVVAERNACAGSGVRLANGLLVGTGDQGFSFGWVTVCSMREPTSPVLLGTYLTGGDGRDVEVVDGILCVADGPAGVIALSLADCTVVFSDDFESGDLSA